ncbi:hypothetical protein Q3G72_026811 [Acer saccharum]|nr:hypothetical protein Q3G72_026811 [Acer saccharum]
MMVVVWCFLACHHHRCDCRGLLYLIKYSSPSISPMAAFKFSFAADSGGLVFRCVWTLRKQKKNKIGIIGLSPFGDFALHCVSGNPRSRALDF